MQAALSATFEMNGRLLTGRSWFLNVNSTPDFFSSGKTRVSFQLSWKWPDCREPMRILVKTGRRLLHSLTYLDGMRSRGHVFRDELFIKVTTSSSNVTAKRTQTCGETPACNLEVGHILNQVRCCVKLGSNLNNFLNKGFALFGTDGRSLDPDRFDNGKVFLIATRQVTSFF